jgi:hypothetical protein
VLLLAGIASAFAMLVLIVLVAAVKPINFKNVRRLELAMEFPFFYARGFVDRKLRLCAVKLANVRFPEL